MNIVFLTTGSANSTVCMKMLSALGWNLGYADDQYAEHIEIRRLNMAIMRGDTFQATVAADILAKLPQPWAVKDPRFSHTLAAWEPLFAPYRPLLLYVTKNTAYVQRSMTRRFGTKAGWASKRKKLCDQHFNTWKYDKLTLDVEQIAAAVRIYDPARSFAFTGGPRHGNGSQYDSRFGTNSNSRCVWANGG